jgi:hypothetical protein
MQLLRGGRVLGIAAIVAVVAGGMAAVGPVGPANAADWTVRGPFVSKANYGDSATVSYKLNRQTTRPKTRSCTLNGAPTRCGRRTWRSGHISNYQANLSGLKNGVYTFRVTVKRSSGGSVTRRTSFTIATGTCRVRSTWTGREYFGNGRNLQTAINAATHPLDTTLKVRGTCVGSFTIVGKSLTLAGPTTGTGSAILDGGGAGNAVLYLSDGEITLNHLTITGGSNGGIFNSEATLSLQNASVHGNTAISGAGIVNRTGLVTLQKSSIRDNTATGSGGGIFNMQGGQVVLRSSSVTGNTGDGDGGGIWNHLGYVTLHDSSVTDNTASSGYGGGIDNTFGSLTLRSSSVTGNHAALAGGGISNSNKLTLLGATLVSGNTAESHGGGIVNGTGGTVRLGGSSSITGNSADTADGPSGGGIYNNGLVNSCDGIGVTPWTGTIIENNPDDFFGSIISSITC